MSVHDGYGQTETGHLTGMPIGPPVRPGSMGRPLPGFRAWIDEGELVVDPATVPTFFIDGPRDRPWRTGDRVSEDDDGYLWFEGRTDDVIISAGYRIGPFEVESALVSHPAVAEAAAVAAPDEVRGQVVRAVVVLRDGHSPSPALATELQEHVKSETAPYKYPRIVDFAPELPKTPSGKIKRAELRDQPSGSSEEVVPQQRVDHPPAPVRLVLEDARVAQQLQRRGPRPGWTRRGIGLPAATVRAITGRLVEQPDPLHHLLHRRAVALERALEADLHEVEADLARVELERDEMLCCAIRMVRAVGRR